MTFFDLLNTHWHDVQVFSYAIIFLMALRTFV
jgi:hypothetical protein